MTETVSVGKTVLSHEIYLSIFFSQLQVSLGKHIPVFNAQLVVFQHIIFVAVHSLRFDFGNVHEMGHRFFEDGFYSARQFIFVLQFRYFSHLVHDLSLRERALFSNEGFYEFYSFAGENIRGSVPDESSISVHGSAG